MYHSVSLKFLIEIYCFPCVEQVPVAHNNNNNDDDDDDGDNNNNTIKKTRTTNLCNKHLEHKKGLQNVKSFRFLWGKN